MQSYFTTAQVVLNDSDFINDIFDQLLNNQDISILINNLNKLNSENVLEIIILLFEHDSDSDLLTDSIKICLDNNKLTCEDIISLLPYSLEYGKSKLLLGYLLNNKSKLQQQQNDKKNNIINKIQNSKDLEELYELFDEYCFNEELVEHIVNNKIIYKPSFIRNESLIMEILDRSPTEKIISIILNNINCSVKNESIFLEILECVNYLFNYKLQLLCIEKLNKINSLKVLS